ncbi:MAG: hypothetical protein FJ029_12615 [Actinobacteria bacterium]|nr:hypothetical protein [Actinomycetota bacterium]
MRGRRLPRRLAGRAIAVRVSAALAAASVYRLGRAPRLLAQSLPPMATAAPTTVLDAARMTTIMTAQVIARFGGNDADVRNAIGLRTSNAWKGVDGAWYLAAQGAILQRIGQRPINIWNTLDQMHEHGYDPQLDAGSFGARVPPLEDWLDGSEGNFALAFRRRIEHFQVPAQVVEFVNALRASGFETGALTARGYGPFVAYRLQRMAVQVWKDSSLPRRVQRVLAGDAAKRAGLVPRVAYLPGDVPVAWVPSAAWDAAPGLALADLLRRTRSLSTTARVVGGVNNTVETVASPNARYIVSTNSAGQNQLMTFVGQEGTIHGFRRRRLYWVALTIDEWPGGILPQTALENFENFGWAGASKINWCTYSRRFRSFPSTMPFA